MQIGSVVIACAILAVVWLTIFVAHYLSRRAGPATRYGRVTRRVNATMEAKSVCDYCDTHGAKYMVVNEVVEVTKRRREERTHDRWVCSTCHEMFKVNAL